MSKMNVQSQKIEIISKGYCKYKATRGMKSYSVTQMLYIVSAVNN